MTHKERVFRTFEFQTVDRPALDIMENNLWPTLMHYFKEKYGFLEHEQVPDILGENIETMCKAVTGRIRVKLNLMLKNSILVGCIFMLLMQQTGIMKDIF